METRFAITPKVSDGRHHKREKRREMLLQVISDKEVLLPRLADYSRRVYRVLSVEDRVNIKYRVVMLQRIIAVVVAERTLGTSDIRFNTPAKRKLCFSDKTVMRSSERALRHPDLSALEQ